MISLSEAQQIALSHLNNGIKPESELVIIDDETIEFDEGYVFSVNTKKYILEGDIGYRIAGLSPILISRKTGEIFDPYVNQYIYPEDLIEQYRRKLAEKE